MILHVLLVCVFIDRGSIVLHVLVSRCLIVSYVPGNLISFSVQHECVMIDIVEVD
jgi:hypothetical protein